MPKISNISSKTSLIKRKMMLLLFGGIAFGYAITPSRQWKVLKEVSSTWKKLDEKILKDMIRQLYQSRIVEKKENSDGSYTIVLTEKGRMKALTYYFEEMKIKKGKWDNKWRLIIFDIPEKNRLGRNVIRGKIKKLGFYELQKSVWVYPYECKDEIDYIIEYYNLRKYVRFLVADFIDNELHLKEIFKLK